MGGTCDEKISGNSLEELSANGKTHVHEAAEAGDEGHKELMDKMGKISPEELEKWNGMMKEKFDSLPEDE
jgi:hypothetical protein